MGSPYDPRVHAEWCAFQCEHYLWECNCGVYEASLSTPAQSSAQILPSTAQIEREQNEAE